MPSALAVERADISRDHPDRPYVTLTFQKIGPPNLRTSRMFFRNPVGCTHSPHGHVRHFAESDFLDVVGDLLALRLIGRAHPVGDELLELRDIRPTEPGTLGERWPRAFLARPLRCPPGLFLPLHSH